MSMREIKSTLASAWKKDYKYSIEKLIELLDISKEEADQIGMRYPICNKNDSKEDQMEKKKDCKERRKRIIHLYQTTDLTQEQVAKEVGVSRKTVGEILRNAGINRANRKAKRIQELSEKGNSVEQISQKVSRSNRTVYRALQNTASEIAGGAPKAAQTELTNPERDSAVVEMEASVPVNTAVEEAAKTVHPTFGEEECAAAKQVENTPVCPRTADNCTPVTASSEEVCDKMSPAPYNNGYLSPVQAHTHAEPSASAATALKAEASLGFPSPLTNTPSQPQPAVNGRVRLYEGIGSSAAVGAAGLLSDGGAVGTVPPQTAAANTLPPVVAASSPACSPPSKEPSPYWGLHDGTLDSQGRRVYRCSPLPASRSIHYHWVWHPIDSKPLPNGYVEPLPLGRRR